MDRARADHAYIRAIGLRMRAARIARQWSQHVLAEHADIDATTVSKAERGIGNPTLLTIIKIARALDKSCADLFPPDSTAS